MSKAIPPARKKAAPKSSRSEFQEDDSPQPQPTTLRSVSDQRSTKAQAKRTALYSGLFLVPVLALVAWLQPPRPGFLPREPFAWAMSWFFYPYEVNPWYRPPIRGFYIRSVTVVPGTNGKEVLALAGHNEILRTTDSGEHWTPEWFEPAGEFTSISFADHQHGWIEVSAPSVELRVTSDGGKTWRALPNTPDTAVGSIQFFDNRRGVGVNGTGGLAVLMNVPIGDIVSTQDGGTTWSKVSNPFSGGNGNSIVAFSDATFEQGCTVYDFNLSHITCLNQGKWAAAKMNQLLFYLYGISFSAPNEAWAVGDNGTLIHTTDGGTSWVSQGSGTMEHLRGVSFADKSNGWIVGTGGTILHTTDGGTTWKPQESAPYRRYAAPWFFASMVFFIPLFVWSTSPERRPKAMVDDIVSADAPIESLDDDRLGQKALVERLTNYLTNPNTEPPLVISLQARWGMGKSSVMRMLQANLKRNRVAVTVWFNAWHHQREDLLLAYLLETVQRQAVPQWLSATGVSFRLDLIRVRMFDPARRDRLALVLLATGFLALRVAMPSLFPSAGWGSWLTKAGYVAIAGVFLGLGKAFKSNPEKLIENAGGFLVDTFKEALKLPSLVGKSDVRQEFAENLKDVAEALKPQRLVIFLDDLDRCRPEQVVQILEAINFLSSVAPVFVVVGADYSKVETLVAKQFEELALLEAENKRVEREEKVDNQEVNRVHLRVAYARDYLKKIVNVRLNLKAPTAEHFADMMERPRIVKAEAGMLPRYGRMLATLTLPVLLVFAAVLWTSRASTSKPAATVAVGKAETDGTGQPQQVAAGVTNRQTAPTQDRANSTLPFPNRASEGGPSNSYDGWLGRNAMLIGIPSMLMLLALVARLTRPANLDQATEDPRFTRALVHHTKAIFDLYQSPREVRRLLNYLRLVAAKSGQGEIDQGQKLRDQHADFDEVLVGLALGGANAPALAAWEIRKYYKDQCGIFGLDPQTFLPRENGSDESADHSVDAGGSTIQVGATGNSHVSALE
ncbi:P-loop NTPase fold protein [Acidicapsa dinghuensis]|uniref:P-loop NTPase fold protein n=1 Tax=Acidicapsa dinghuensis TaxID=2218256 RepID=A0ABW1EEJ4_9BACT|nr:P-loop NTPase fold protein [Acidicapsa dinghuensis]